MRTRLEDHLRRLGIAGDTATALGFVVVALVAVAIGFAVEIAIHGW
jgi:hypothetical protein